MPKCTFSLITDYATNIRENSLGEEFGKDESITDLFRKINSQSKLKSDAQLNALECDNKAFTKEKSKA